MYIITLKWPLHSGLTVKYNGHDLTQGNLENILRFVQNICVIHLRLFAEAQNIEHSGNFIHQNLLPPVNHALYCVSFIDKHLNVFALSGTLMLITYI